MTDRDLIDEARWIFAQIAQMHSTDHGDPAERCMELGRKGYELLRDGQRSGDCERPAFVSESATAFDTPE